MCAFQTDLSILKDYDTDFFQARSSEKRTLIERTEVDDSYNLFENSGTSQKVMLQDLLFMLWG